MEYKALVFDGRGNSSFEILNTDEMTNDIMIKVVYSSINYKDALALDAKNHVMKNYPGVAGIDMIGTVVESKSNRFHIGDEVIVTSHDILNSVSGGFAEYASVPENEVTHLPRDLTMRQAAIIGTAGFTAALSIYRMMQSTNPIKRDPVLVLGATGGVGSCACAILTKLGYPIVAVSTKKDSAKDYLAQFNVTEVLSPQALMLEPYRPLNTMQWTAVIDPIGGNFVKHVLPFVKYEGVYLLSGNVAGTTFDTTVFPFILRGVQLIGIDSVNSTLKDLMWELIARDYRPSNLSSLVAEEITLLEVPEALKRIKNHDLKGRIIIKVN